MRDARGVIHRLYRAASEGCAESVVRVPAIERSFVRVGPHLWSRPGVGQFYRSTAWRVAWRMRRRNDRFRPLLVEGTPLVLDATEFTTRGLYFGAHLYESATTAYLSRALRPGGVFVDIGANHGYFSMLAAAKVGPTGRVAAFEPNPAVFAQLATHVALNGFESRVLLSPMALADEPTPAATLFVSRDPGNSGLSSLTPSDEAIATGSLSSAETIAVRVETFDNWFAESGLDRIDLVKIDVEGGEGRVVAGMQHTIAAGSVGAVICETVWDSEAHRVLCGAGYVPQALDAVGHLTNVLYARAGETGAGLRP